MWSAVINLTSLGDLLLIFLLSLSIEQYGGRFKIVERVSEKFEHNGTLKSTELEN